MSSFYRGDGKLLRVHKLAYSKFMNSPEPHPACNGRSTRMSENWDEVTCYLCLKMKAAEEKVR